MAILLARSCPNESGKDKQQQQHDACCSCDQNACQTRDQAKKCFSLDIHLAESCPKTASKLYDKKEPIKFKEKRNQSNLLDLSCWLSPTRCIEYAYSIHIIGCHRIGHRIEMVHVTSSS